MGIRTLRRKKELQNKGNFIREVSEKIDLPESKVLYYTSLMLEKYFDLKTHRARIEKRRSQRYRHLMRIKEIKEALEKELQNK